MNFVIIIIIIIIVISVQFIANESCELPAFVANFHAHVFTFTIK